MSPAAEMIADTVFGVIMVFLALIGIYQVAKHTRRSTTSSTHFPNVLGRLTNASVGLADSLHELEAGIVGASRQALLAATDDIERGRDDRYCTQKYRIPLIAILTVT